MIVISDCSKDIVIPAGLGDNAGVVYEVAGVKSLNGETGDLKIKTVNGNDMLGEGNIEIKGGVETVNGETGDVKIKTVNGQSLMGEGDVPVDVGVETLNGQKGNLKIKSVNGAEMLGEGNVAIDTGVESLNGQKGNVSLKTVNGNELTGNGNIEIKAGVESVNGETGAVTLKTINNQDITGEGNVAIDTGVETLNGQKGALTLKTVNGNELTGDGNIEIKAGVESVNGKTGAVEVQDLGEYAICALQMSDITLSEADTDVMLWNYGAGKDNGRWSKYVSGDRTLQILLIRTKDRKGYKVPVEIHLMNDDQENAEMHFTIGDYRYVYSQVSNMHWKFTSKTPVNSGGGSDNVIVLDNLSQEERKAVYDKLDKTKAPNAVFIYNHSSSFRTYWDGDVLHLYFFEDEYSGITITDHSLRSDGSIENIYPVYKYNNSLTLNVRTQINDGADFECDYVGNYFEYIVRPYTRPNSYYILFSNGIGNSTKPVFAPVSVIWDKNYDTDGAGPIRIQFTANEKLYTYLHDSNQENKWLFESAKPIGGVQSSEVSNIKVLTQAEYDALTSKDENVLYCIKG